MNPASRNVQSLPRMEECLLGNGSEGRDVDGAAAQLAQIHQVVSRGLVSRALVPPVAGQNEAADSNPSEAESADPRELKRQQLTPQVPLPKVLPQLRGKRKLRR